ncbi:MAG: PfaD family protein [Massilibacillus sp.]|jgi:trans-AT polyketide synthase/acyltransferase/oxidoreductase domain-containing protein|nr:PfaD family protein [Massilibacillus sp.]
MKGDNKRMVTYVFPGQGSQTKGMGDGLFDEFEELTLQADGVLGYSIKELCLEDPNQTIGMTQYTQPALYVVNALSYLQKVNNIGEKPDFVAGHSLGEYNALFAAGAFDFATGLKLVQKRGELMSHAIGGGMAAVIGLTAEQVADALISNGLENIDIANYNSPTQIVISGRRTDIENAQPIFERVKGVKMYVILKTSGAFHSRYMEQSRKEYEGFISNIQFSELMIPVISNFTARPYKQSEIRQNLIQQITHPVKWTESIRYLMGLGEMEFEEIGPGKVLSGLARRIKNEAEPLIVSQDDQSIDPLVKAVEEHNVVPIKSHKTVAKEAIRAEQNLMLSASSLGSLEFKKDYGLKYAYLTGGMYRGVASIDMVVKMGKAGMMGYLGTGGLQLSDIEQAIESIQHELSAGESYGINLLHNPNNPEKEERTVDIFLKHGVKKIEAAAFLNVTPALVKYRAKGLKRNLQGEIFVPQKIMVKVSRPEVAAEFLTPAPERIVSKLLEDNKITQEEAELLKKIPMADYICVEADSGGHTDGGVAYTLMPAMIKLRDEMMKKHQYIKKVGIGAAGGIGTPAAAAAAFILGADFILTGSINQCTVEAATSDNVKNLLQQMNVQDTEYVPAGDMFEIGAKVQVLKKGLFFPGRANKLYELYRKYNSLDEIDEKTKIQIQEKYFNRSFKEVYEDVKKFYPPQEIEKAERNPKHKMALIFRWYFGYSSQLALKGDEKGKVDYQIHCGPALGAFNQWIKETPLENWQNRHVDEIAEKIMAEAAVLLNQRYNTLMKNCI